MTNYGALAILAKLRTQPARLRTMRSFSLLIALETFKADADGWREVSAEELRAAAGLNPKTYDRARSDLIGAGLAEYQPATHRGERSRWRITFPLDDPPPKKGATRGGDLPAKKGATQGGDLPKGATQGGDSTTVEGAHTRGVKGPHTGWATALEPSALKADGGSLRTTRTGSRGGRAATPATADLDGRAEGAPAAAARPASPPGRAARLPGQPPGWPGRGQCRECGDWYVAKASGGRMGRHKSYASGLSWCRGSLKPPVDPVPCARCGQTGVALTSGQAGLCHACVRDLKAAEEAGP